MPTTTPRRFRRVALLAAMAVVAGLSGAAAATAEAPGTSSHVPPSSYGDPCEGRSRIDLREVRLADLFEDDRATVRSGTVRVDARLCSLVRPQAGDTVRVDLHPRLDAHETEDYSETASRILTIGFDGVRWSWRLRTERGTTVSTGTAAPHGEVDEVGGVVADVPACDLAAASGSRCDGDRRLPGRAPGPLPPLALRVCSADVDCGPAFRTVGDTTQPDPTPVRADVDYLPEPRYLQLTYPSICQVGGVARTPLTAQRDEFLATATAAEELVEAGFVRLGELPGGWVRMRGSLGAARDHVAADQLQAVAVRRQQATPDDPWFAATGPGAPTGQWSLRRVGLEASREVTTGSGTRVAVIDTGMDGRHPDLRGRAIEVRDFVATRDGGTGGRLDRDADTDLGGHGTFVASTIAAVTDNGEGIASLAPDTRLLVARVFDAEGCASDGAVVQAMAWALNSGADALNLSLGGTGLSPALEAAGIEAVARGAVPVAAAGNSGGAVLEFPAAYPSYLSVAATGFQQPGSGDEDPVATYSTRNGQVDIAAPGGSNASGDRSRDVLGACWVSPGEGRGYCRESGTSFAAPLVTAGVALVRSLDPDRTVPGVEQLLADSARDIRNQPGTDPGRDDRTGAGRLDVGRATALLAARVDTLDDLPDSGDPTAASVKVSRTAFPQADARHVVIARDDVFADSLAGAGLAGGRGPILLTSPRRLESSVEAELRRVMPGGGRVWLLGGEAAISDAVVQRVRALGYSPARLHGPTRVETAAAIARRVGRHPDGQVLVASAANWPDAIAAGLYAADRGVPLLLSWPDSAADERSPGVLRTARELGARDVVMLGGEAALSAKVAAQIQTVAPVRRVAGATRFDTAAEVARVLWGRTRGAPGQQFVLVNGDRDRGWAMGLAAAPLGARSDAPLLLVNDGLTTTEPARYLRNTLGYRLDRPGRGLVVGPFTDTSTTRVRAFTAQRLRELLGG